MNIYLIGLLIVLAAVVYFSVMLSTQNSKKKKLYGAFAPQLATYAASKNMAAKPDHDIILTEAERAANIENSLRLTGRSISGWYKKSKIIGYYGQPKSRSVFTCYITAQLNRGISTLHKTDYRLISSIKLPVPLENAGITKRHQPSQNRIIYSGSEIKPVSTTFDEQLVYYSNSGLQKFIQKPEVQTFFLGNSAHDYEIKDGVLFISSVHEFTIDQVEHQAKLLAELSALIA